MPTTHPNLGQALANCTPMAQQAQTLGFPKPSAIHSGRCILCLTIPGQNLTAAAHKPSTAPCRHHRKPPQATATQSGQPPPLTPNIAQRPRPKQNPTTTPEKPPSSRKSTPSQTPTTAPANPPRCRKTTPPPKQNNLQKEKTKTSTTIDRHHKQPPPPTSRRQTPQKSHARQGTKPTPLGITGAAQEQPDRNNQPSTPLSIPKPPSTSKGGGSRRESEGKPEGGKGDQDRKQGGEREMAWGEEGRRRRLPPQAGKP